VDPTYFASKLNCFIGLGPATSLANIGSTFISLIAKFKIDTIFEILGRTELMANSDFVNQLQARLCSYAIVFCTDMLEMISDANAKDDDFERFLVYSSHFPAGSSLQALQAFSESVRNKNFVNFVTKVPFPLENIKGLPITLLVGTDDRLATVADNRILKEILQKQNTLEFYKEYEMGHASFFLSLLNPHINDLLDSLRKANF